MLTFSNFLSVLRIPLALLFLQKSIPIRVSAIILAMITDSFDGYFARKTKSVTKLGTILDPIMDKFFVYFTLSVLYLENKILLWQAITFLSRDIALFIFASFFLLFHKKLSKFEIKAIRWGKVTTAIQFILLIAITFNISFSPYIYFIFILLSILAFIELILRHKKSVK